MPVNSDKPLTIAQRRRAMRLAYSNGMIWAVGNGLASTALVVYLALELGVARAGLGIALILAAPCLAGLLRLGAPAIVGRLVDRKRFCLGCYLLGTCVLLTLPWASAPGMLPSSRGSLSALIVLWCVYHLMQYLGTIALWSWLADLVPLRIRGRFIGRRNRWMVVGEAAAMIASGLFVSLWKEWLPSGPKWHPYAISAGLGACFMIAAVVPLAMMTRATGRASSPRASVMQSIRAPFADPRFLRLVLFGCWFSLSTGITQSVQYTYTINILGVGFLALLSMKTGMRGGQFAVSPWMGRLADRIGNRSVMIVCLLICSQGPAFYLFATPETWWWITGAWVAWIAYAGLNVCLPNLMLKLSPEQSNTPYIAMYGAVTGLCYALNTILGGYLYDELRDETFQIGTAVLDYYDYIFLLGWITRSLGVLVLLMVIEPTSSVLTGSTASRPYGSRRSESPRRR
ncbi:MAG: MFS transporter [Candidatus Nealsonbacteria bacterium]|nr:MFS transporter [Candidatus Nealsonbacteria bacterium]